MDPALSFNGTPQHQLQNNLHGLITHHSSHLFLFIRRLHSNTLEYVTLGGQGYTARSQGSHNNNKVSVLSSQSSEKIGLE